jgi:hypothetical protein
MVRISPKADSSASIEGQRSEQSAKLCKSNLAICFAQTFAGCERMMLQLLLKLMCGVVYIMSRLGPKKYCEPQITDNSDRALSEMLDALRKPLKLTATLKRRALRNKIAGKTPRPEVLSGEVKSESAVTPNLFRV